MRFLPTLLLLFALFAATGCGGRADSPFDTLVGEPVALDPQRIDGVRAFLAGSDRYNTYSRTSNGKPRDPVSRILLRNPEQPDLWDAYDTLANRIEFEFSPERGVYLLRGENGTYRGRIAFDEPLLYAPPELERGVDFRNEVGFAVWTDKRTTSTGDANLELTYEGVEEIPVLGESRQVWRVDSRFTISIRLLLGTVSVWVDQRQWLDPEWGEVRREIEGTYGFLGVGLRGFNAVQEMTATRPLEPADVDAILAIYRNPPPPPKGRVDEE
ncbi:MAG: hypothetical protein SF028_09780 [Candidatus Sumerlaeia bacterium]|nr:hypothetical protein [Candidatus Sumerlaeia bacterium]